MRAIVIVCAALACGCGAEPEEAPSSTVPRGPAREAPKARPRIPEGQAARILVEHIVISFAGNARGLKSLRPRDEAERLAKSLLERIRGGADFMRLRDEFSDDRPEGAAVATGPYIYCNFGVEHRLRPDGVAELPRKDLYTRVGDIAFRLEVGETGFAEYDEKLCPYGWDIIRRVK